jgi:hypothetical protein
MTTTQIRTHTRMHHQAVIGALDVQSHGMEQPPRERLEPAARGSPHRTRPTFEVFHPDHLKPSARALVTLEVFPPDHYGASLATVSLELGTFNNPTFRPLLNISLTTILLTIAY